MSQKDEIRVESGDDSAFAKDSGKAGIVKDSQAGIVGDSAKVEGGIHQHTQKAEASQGAVQAESIGRFEQHYHKDTPFKCFWIAAGVIALVCLISALIFFGRPDIEQNIRGNGNTAVITGDGDVSIDRESK
ncbi:MAG: hypothetical protein GY795_50580 [Desulfobacterales bacterium]|nr:hypothetical protein [Desulfobacterales bacterium]